MVGSVDYSLGVPALTRKNDRAGDGVKVGLEVALLLGPGEDVVAQAQVQR